MSKQNQTAERMAALERELAELKAAQPKPEPSREEQERATAKWIDEMHQMREGRMSLATPPSVVREMSVLDDHLVKEIALRDARAPTGRPGMIPGSQQPTSPRQSAGDGTGWAHEMPIGPSMHQRYVDAQLDAQDAKDRQERIQQAASAEMARKFAERSEKLQRLIEQNKKLIGKTK